MADKEEFEDEEEDFDEEDEEDINFEEDDKDYRQNQSKEEKKVKPKKVSSEDEEEAPKPKKSIKFEGITYSAFRLPERVGVVNNKTKEPIGEDVYSILASIKNDLQEIKDGLL